MKKIAYLSVILLVIAACSSEPHYTVKGNVEGSDSLTFLLQKRADGKIVTIDSAVSRKGIFKMSNGRTEYPDMVYLTVKNKNARASFWLENSEITINGKLDSLYNATVKGSKTQDEYQSYVDGNKPLNEQYSKLYADYQAARKANDTARVSAIEKEAESLSKQMKDNEMIFIKDHPASYVTPTLIRSLSYEMEPGEIESAINALDTNVAKVQIITDLKQRLVAMKAVAVGQKAPDFTLNDVNGNPVSLSSKIGSKLLLIDFWAAWCGPCRAENPNVVKVYNQFHKKGFDILGVSLDQTKDAWTKAIADDKLTWTHVSDLQYWNSAAAKLYAVNAIPANFLLDESGTIIARNLRGEDLAKKVGEILGK